jgi:hypothetical protein
MKTAALFLPIALVCAAAGPEGAVKSMQSQPLGEIEIPFEGQSQLAAILSRGREGPDEESVLVVKDRTRRRVVDVNSPRRVRWLSPDELMVEQNVPVVNGSGVRILRVNREGGVVEVLADREGLINAEPSPGGGQVLVERFDQQGYRGLEVRSVHGEGFVLQRALPLVSDASPSSLMTPAVWSPDGSRFASARYLPDLPDLPDHPGRLHPRLMVSRGHGTAPREGLPCRSAGVARQGNPSGRSRHRRRTSARASARERLRC